MKQNLLMKILRLLAWCWCAGIVQSAIAQNQTTDSDAITLPLNDMSAFKPVADNWRIAGDVTADRNVKEALKASPGKGILVNIPTEKKHDNLVTVMEHGDLELDLDFMMAKGSNSGIYLQGRYEIQLYDSWGVKKPAVHDCGAIYERWDDSKPEGQKGYQGHAPRLNVSRAPGLWQHYHISFQAPRFNAQGQKIQNAKILEIVQNGVTIHENVEMTGPTRGPLAPNEVATGPLLIQGDHGPVAFRNIRYKNYDQAPLALSDLKYSYYGKFDRDPDFSKLKADAEGNTPELTWEVSKTPTDFVLRYSGKLKITTPGDYHFYLFNAGRGRLKVANQTLVNYGDWEGEGTVKLTAGDQPIEIVYAKAEPWYSPALGLFVEGPGIRRQPLHSMSSVPMRDPVDPILLNVNGTEPTMLRSFMDYKRDIDAKSHRITHAISVGSPAGVHYTMDLDNGALAQVWKGGFLNTTPMWHDRGDGSSRPMGSVVLLNDTPVLQVLSNPNAAWIDTLSTEAAYRFKGYDIDENGRPVFKYTLYGTEVEDLTMPEDDGKMLTRNLKVSGPNVANLYVRLADGKDIVQLPDGTYSVSGNEYYLKIDGSTKPTLRTVNNRKELLMPVSGGTVKYSLIW